MPAESTGINALTEAIALRSETTDKAIKANTTAQAENTRAIAQLGAKIDKLSDTINNQSASSDRLERAVTKLVKGIEAQSENMKSFLALATKQADTIGDLARSRAS